MLYDVKNRAGFRDWAWEEYSYKNKGGFELLELYFAKNDCCIAREKYLRHFNQDTAACIRKINYLAL